MQTLTYCFIALVWLLLIYTFVDFARYLKKKKQALVQIQVITEKRYNGYRNEFKYLQIVHTHMLNRMGPINFLEWLEAVNKFEETGKTSWPDLTEKINSPMQVDCINGVMGIINEKFPD